MAQHWEGKRSQEGEHGGREDEREGEEWGKGKRASQKSAQSSHDRRMTSVPDLD